MKNNTLPLAVCGGAALLAVIAAVSALRSEAPEPGMAADDVAALVETTIAQNAASGADAFDLAALTPEQQDAFGAQVRAYLMANPAVIMEAVAVLEEQEQAQQEQADLAMVDANRDALVNDGYSWVGGNPEGDFTIVEFLDYRCGFCRRATPEVMELIESDGNIRLIIKEFPILGEASTVSSRFAIATHMVEGDDAYKTVHDALITLEGAPTEPALSRLASTLGFDVDAIFEAMETEEVDRRISETREVARALNITGTPTFVFGDQMVRGYAPLDVMREIVDAGRSDG